MIEGCCYIFVNISVAVIVNTIAHLFCARIYVSAGIIAVRIVWHITFGSGTCLNRNFEISVAIAIRILIEGCCYTLVNLTVAVIVNSIADLCCARIDGIVVIITIPINYRCVETLRISQAPAVFRAVTVLIKIVIIDGAIADRNIIYFCFCVLISVLIHHNKLHSIEACIIEYVEWILVIAVNCSIIIEIPFPVSNRISAAGLGKISKTYCERHCAGKWWCTFKVRSWNRFCYLNILSRCI